MDTASAGSIATHVTSNAVNYNSEWNKLCLLLWKNSRIIKNTLSNLTLMVIAPLAFCLLPILLRLTQSKLTATPLQLHNAINISEKWAELQTILDDRIIETRRRFPDFQHNAFIPRKVIGYAPSDQTFRTIMKKTEHNLKPMTLELFSTCTELQTAIAETALYCGVCFRKDDKQHSEDDELKSTSKYPSYFTYTLMYPSYLRLYNDTFMGNTWQTNALYPLVSVNQVQNPIFKKANMIGYVREGFAYVQHKIAITYINELILENNTNLTIPKLVLNPYPQQEKMNDILLERMDFGISLMILLCNTYPILTTVAMIVREKEERSKIFTQIAGIDNYLHYLAWIIKAFIQSFYTSVIVVILLKIQWSSGLAIFNKTTFLAWLIVICLYNITSICFCLMVTAFCNVTRSAVYVTSLLWFLTYIPFWATAMFTESRLHGINLVAMLLFHNTVLGYIIEIIMGYEEQNSTAGSLIHFFKSTNMSGNYNIGQYIGIMLAQGVLYMVIGLYAEELMPTSYGLTKRLTFLSRRKNSSIHERDKDYKYMEYAIATNRTESFIHEIASTNPILVDIKGVSKKYGDEVIVSNFNLQLRENEITILTGHNGCGKTTIVTMICGLIPPTTGNIQIEGFSVLKDQKYACASLGVSMEQSTLYEDLTVEDQLRFFSFLKGLSPKAVEQDIQKYLQSTNLMSHRNVKTRYLTKGVRQELGVCCALTGRSRIVILDEPNASVDPEQRKRIWDLLTQEKQGRTILIATNFSECFSFLADRVAILSSGELQCVGSPAFLRKIYAQGYRLTCSCLPGYDPREVTQLLRKYVPNVNPVSTLGNIIMYLIDEKYGDILEELGAELGENVQRLRLRNYGIAQCSLRDINIKMGSYMPPLENRTRLVEALNGISLFPEENQNIKFIEIKERLHGYKRFKQHFKAYFTFYWLTTRHYKLYMLKKFLLPPIFTWLAFFTSTYSFKHTPLTPMIYGLEQYDRTITTVHIKNNISDDMKKIAESYSKGVFWLGTKHTLDDTKSVRFEEYILKKSPKLRVDSHSNIGISFLQDRVVCWFNHFALHAVPLTLNLYHNALQSVVLGEKARIKVSLQPIDTGTVYSDGHFLNALSAGVLLAGFIMLSFCFISNGIVFTIIKERKTGLRNMQESSGLQLWIYWIVYWLNDALIIFISSIFIVLTILFIELNAAMTITPTPYLTFFISIFLGGYCLYSFNYMIAEMFTDEINGFICTLMIGGLSLLTFCHYEQNYHHDYIGTPTDLLSPYLLLIPHIVMCGVIMTIYYTQSINDVCLNRDIQFQSKEVENCTLTPNCCETYQYFNFYSDIPVYLSLLILYSILFWTIILGKRTKLFWDLWKIPRDNLTSQLIDHQQRHNIDDTRYNEQSVVAEANDIIRLSGTQMREAPLVCDKAGRLYGKNIGVDRVSLIIKRGEIVGLVGETGSGKTCLCKLITTNENLSFGRIYTMGISSIRERKTVLHSVGYSQQRSSKFPELTMENLLIYLCRLHDYPPQHINAICINLVKILGLHPHYHKPLNTISHGTYKAFLCAIALLGNRPLLIIDSLSVAIDQVTRYMIWRTLLRVQSEGTAILCTLDHFSEMERYCNRLCILSKGRCTYLGPPNNFDVLYRNYLVLKIKLYHKIQEAKNDINNKYIYISCLNKLQRFMSNEFPTSHFRYELGNCLMFLMPTEDNRASHVFNTLQRNTYFLNIEHFELHDAFHVSFEEFVQLQSSIYR